MRARVPALAAVALAAAGVAATAVLGRNGEDDGSSINRGGRVVAVSRQTLVERETVQGTLGYAGSRTVLHRLGGSGDEAPSGSADSTSSGAESTGAAATDAPAVIPAAYFPPDQDPPVEDEQPKSEDRPQDKEEPAPKEEEKEEEEKPVPEEEEEPVPDEEEPASDDSEQGEASPGDSTGQDPSAGESTGSASQGDPGTSSSDGARGGQTGSPQDDASSGDSSSGSGATSSNTVTALARPGSVVRRGGALYRVDGDPVVLMYGSTPAYRDLELGVEDGQDVRQLERNFAALGFDPGTVDSSFTSATAEAVTDWQESAGLPETGSVELGRVVFQPGARRIGEHKTEVGSVLAAGAEVLDTSSTRRVVTVELDAALQSLARKGGGVEVTLPDQSTVRGRITDVGRVAREKEDSGSDSGAADPTAEPELIIDVTVRLRSARGLGRLDEAPVSVGLAQESRRNALAVPVNALVARRGGGYGVELASSGRIVPVRTGLFAGGYVEVSGKDIREGTRVVVPDA
jgi:hypothetical protein